MRGKQISCQMKWGNFAGGDSSKETNVLLLFTIAGFDRLGTRRYKIRINFSRSNILSNKDGLKIEKKKGIKEGG